MIRNSIAVLACLIGVIFTITGCGPEYSTEDKGDYILVHQDGPTLGYTPTSGVRLLTVDGKAFKDLNKNGKLDAYEDWRLPVEERATDLSKKMSIEQIAGLMLYSGHQAIPFRKRGKYRAMYNGKLFNESGAKASDLTDDQKTFLTKDNLRHVLITSVESPAIAAQWSNNAQALVEGIGLGIPVNTSSDPRHGSDPEAEYNAGAGGEISMWPETLGLAASFDPLLMKQFGEIASSEYRALGITTALSPQIDLATEPRWRRFAGTMGEDPDLATDLARAYVDGFQTSSGNYEMAGGWGTKSVNAMVKHWPGGGPEEGGRDAHFGYGAYAVYPGNNLQDHLKPFTEGALKLDGATGMASAVMPYYTISFNRDVKYGENLGNSFNKYLITDLLRKKYGYDGVVCTDWSVTKDVSSVYKFAGKSWGVEDLSIDARHYKALEAGVDQFGGNNEMEPVIDAYNMGIKEHGKEFMRNRFEKSAVRLLRNIFQVGLFENPYLDPAESEKIVGNPEFMKAGYEAQLRSVVMLKNQEQTLPLKKQAKVFVPKRFIPEGKNWIGAKIPESRDFPFNMDILKKYFNVVDDATEADFALVGIESPKGGSGFDPDDLNAGGNGYVPISLKYGAYRSDFARDRSIAGGSPFEDFTNRSYRGKTVTTSNRSDMNLVNETKSKMGNKPVIVVADLSNPMVFSEIEKSTSAILIHTGVQDQAIMDILSGEAEPSAMLPFQLPANMKTVEEQYEDVPRDMKCYIDSDGNTYDFGFGLNWNGVIQDERYDKYK